MDRARWYTAGMEDALSRSLTVAAVGAYDRVVVLPRTTALNRSAGTLHTASS
jgi:hypothetical protein